MDLSVITKKVLTEISDEVKKDDNMNIIKHDILDPIIRHIIDELYPYFIKISIGAIIILIFIIITLFLNLRIIYRN
tara:strand:- start:2156 stop:2383 length:228 start_codon:yes stop_codon:yes gene_type:complete